MLRKIAEGVWEDPGDPGQTAGPGLPLRMTALRLADGGLLIHSPVPLSDEAAAALSAEGPVRFIVAPNLFHHLHLKAAAARFPDAEVLAAPGLAEKLGDLPPHRILDGALADPWGGEIRWQPILGMPRLNEVALLHQPSRTLILTDLIFNVHEAASWVSRTMLRMTGAWQKTTFTRVGRLLVKDRDAAQRSAGALLDWDFDRIIMSHGEVIEGDGRGRLSRALAPLLEG